MLFELVLMLNLIYLLVEYSPASATDEEYFATESGLYELSADPLPPNFLKALAGSGVELPRSARRVKLVDDENFIRFGEKRLSTTTSTTSTSTTTTTTTTTTAFFDSFLGQLKSPDSLDDRIYNVNFSDAGKQDYQTASQLHSNRHNSDLFEKHLQDSHLYLPFSNANSMLNSVHNMIEEMEVLSGRSGVVDGSPSFLPIIDYQVPSYDYPSVGEHVVAMKKYVEEMKESIKGQRKLKEKNPHYVAALYEQGTRTSLKPPAPWFYSNPLLYARQTMRQGRTNVHVPLAMNEEGSFLTRTSRHDYSFIRPPCCSACKLADAYCQKTCSKDKDKCQTHPSDDVFAEHPDTCQSHSQGSVMRGCHMLCSLGPAASNQQFVGEIGFNVYASHSNTCAMECSAFAESFSSTRSCSEVLDDCNLIDWGVDDIEAAMKHSTIHASLDLTMESLTRNLIHSACIRDYVPIAGMFPPRAARTRMKDSMKEAKYLKKKIMT